MLVDKQACYRERCVYSVTGTWSRGW